MQGTKHFIQLEKLICKFLDTFETIRGQKLSYTPNKFQNCQVFQLRLIIILKTLIKFCYQ